MKWMPVEREFSVTFLPKKLKQFADEGDKKTAASSWVG